MILQGQGEVWNSPQTEEQLHLSVQSTVILWATYLVLVFVPGLKFLRGSL